MLKDIPNYEGDYKVSDKGEVFSFKRKQPKLLKPDNRKGYLSVTLSKNGKLTRIAVHRLVALTWIPNPDNKLYINHKNLNKLDNSVNNLEWVTLSENCKHAYKNGALAPILEKAKIKNNLRRKASDQKLAEKLIGKYLISIEQDNYRTIFNFYCEWCGNKTSARSDADRIKHSARCNENSCRKLEKKNYG